MTLVHQFLETWADRTPDAVAIVEPSRSISYAALDEMANRFSHALINLGVQPGDRVVLAIENSIELVAGYFGTLKAGGVAVPVPPGPRSDRLGAVITDCAPAVCLVDAATVREMRAGDPLAGVRGILSHARGKVPSPEPALDLAAAVRESSPDRPNVPRIDLDLAAIIYTSGSTGTPRGVMLRHRNIVANTRSIVSYLELTAADRVMCVLPLYYVYGLSLLHTHAMVGGSVVLDNRFMYPNLVLEAMQEHRVTGFAGVPSTFALLLHRSSLPDMQFPALRYVTQAGGAMPPARVQEWLEKGPRVPFFVMYGATEASARLSYLPPSELPRKLGSIGRAVPNTELVVRDEHGNPAASGEIGELTARGSNISPGYWNDPAETAAKFGPFGYRTGDLGYVDDEGFLFLVGRRQDMIKVGAHRVGAGEIENVLHELAGVHEVAVVGAPHDILGEVPVAFVAPREGSVQTAEDIRAFCATRLAPYKVPARVMFVSEMPRTTGAGKIDRMALRSRATVEAS